MAEARDEIYEEVVTHGWNAKRQAFAQHYGGKCLETSVLVMPLVFFMAPNDRTVMHTLDAIGQPTDQGGLLSDGGVYRYNVSETKDG